MTKTVTESERDLVAVPRQKKPRLEHYSKAFAKKLFGAHPEWKKYAGYYQEADEDGFLQNYLEVLVPSVHPTVAEPLVIRTRPDEVYLNWAGWHDHVIAWHHQDEDSHLTEAVSHIDLWLSDDYLFATVFRGSERVREWGVRIDGVHPDDLQPKPGQQTLIRSWRGTHDRTV